MIMIKGTGDVIGQKVSCTLHSTLPTQIVTCEET